MEVTIITRRKVTNRQRDTIVITSTMRNTATKKDRHQDINGRNQIIVNEMRRNLLLRNRRMHFTYICFVENYMDRSRQYIWSGIEWRVSYALSLLRFNNNFILDIKQMTSNKFAAKFYNNIIIICSV